MIALLTTLCLFAPQQVAQGSWTVTWDVPIVNPSFEEVSRPLAVGELSNGMAGAGVEVGTRPNFYSAAVFDDPVIVPGWRTFQPGGGATLLAGVMNPPVDQGQPFVTGHTGTYVASSQVMWTQQTLEARVLPGTNYRLTFKSGMGLWEPGGGVHVAVVAAPDRSTLAFPGVPDVITLALSTGFLPPFGTEGQMLPWSLEFQTPDVLPARLQGRYLAIAFIGSDGIPIMNFDDFRLRATREFQRVEIYSVP